MSLKRRIARQSNKQKVSDLVAIEKLWLEGLEMFHKSKQAIIDTNARLTELNLPKAVYTPFLDKYTELTDIHNDISLEIDELGDSTDILDLHLKDSIVQRIVQANTLRIQVFVELTEVITEAMTTGAKDAIK